MVGEPSSLTAGSLFMVIVSLLQLLMKLPYSVQLQVLLSIFISVKLRQQVARARLAFKASAEASVFMGQHLMQTNQFRQVL